MHGMVGQVVHEDYHIEFVRTRDHLVEKPLWTEHQGSVTISYKSVDSDLN
jgi:hypothetical protein